MSTATVPDCKWRRNGSCLRRARELLIASGELSAEGPDPPPVEELDPWLPRILQGEIDAPCRAISQGCCRYARKPPRYDPVRRELWVDGDCVLQLSPLDATQHAILKAFQDRGWPETVSFDDVYQEDASREDGRNN